MNGKIDLKKILPKIIGFGKLDEEEIKIQYSEGDKEVPIIQALYRDRSGGLVYKIKLESNSCHVEEFFEGRTISWTKFSTLEGAFRQKFMTFKDHPRFEELVKRVKKNKKILIQSPDEGEAEISFFPAGLIFVLRFPVIGMERLNWIEGLKSLKEAQPQVHSLNKGTILVLNVDDELIHRPVPVVEFLCTLWELEETIELIFNEGLIPEIEAGVICLEVLNAAAAAPGSFRIYNSTRDGAQISFFSLLLEREGDISLEQAEEYLRKKTNRIKQVKDNEDLHKVKLKVRGELFGTMVGFEVKNVGILCVECYRRNYGTMVSLDSCNVIYEEESKKDFSRGTSGFFQGEDEVVICHQCARIVLRIS